MLKRKLLIDNLMAIEDFIRQSEEVRDFFRHSRFFFDSDLNIETNLVDRLISSCVYILDGNEELEDLFVWFIFEKDFGTNFNYGDFEDNGKIINFYSIEEFIDYLLEDEMIRKGQNISSSFLS